MNLFKKNKSRYSLALIFSISLHFFSFGFIYKKINHPDAHQTLSHHNHAESPRAVRLDSVKFITQAQLKAIKDSRNKQVVANENNGKKEHPEKSRFAGETDQKFDRQIIAANNGIFKKAGIGIKTGAESTLAKTQEAAVAINERAKNKKENQKIPKALSLSELGSIQISKVEDEVQNKTNEFQAMAKKLALESKKANAAGLTNGSAESTGLARNNDFVEEVPLGDMTNLNTTEFKYYGFYHRIRQKLEQYWGSTIQSKAKNLYKSGRRLPASENLITAITVTIDDRGNILDIKIDGTSGIRELDQAAIESFNKAGPFPNPPKGLLVGGRAVIQWGFVVKS